MKFKSKIDWWFHLTVVFVVIMSVFPLYFYAKDKVTTALIVSVIMIIADVLLILPIYFSTNYTLHDTFLHVRCGLINIKIAYNDINSISETEDSSASFGLSLDRISIVYKNKSEVIISPKDKQEFIRLIRERAL